LRNSHDKSFRLSCTVGLRVFVCENLAFHGEYPPSWRSIRRTSRSKTAWPLVSTGCTETSAL
jgi:hypothetical protein